jgi:L-alanine-DL-glutamate epimerase-like enolase superfamily enzyme
MSKGTDIGIRDISLYFLPVKTRIPLKFGPETTTRVICARVRILVENAKGVTAEGWGETPLNIQWVWVSSLPLEERERELERFTVTLAKAFKDFPVNGHPMEISHDFQSKQLPDLLKQHNRDRAGREPMPWLAALVACSLFDLALHDAFGNCNSVGTYETYNEAFMNRDLSEYISPLENRDISYKGLYPERFLAAPRPDSLPAWHLVGGMDLIDSSEITGNEPDDGHPFLLRDWIKRDGLSCLKIKLKGNDEAWDYTRITEVGRIAVDLGVKWLSADFNCTVQDPQYVIEILDRLLREQPRYYGMLLYVEQPFPYDLEQNLIDVHAISARKPLFMDESAHDWKLVRLGSQLGWTGVALKTCKTQTGALLSLCWARTHGMTLMVQDLSNPMLAIIPHLLLAAYAGTIMGVETNSSQFYPEASRPESLVHPGIYRRKNGRVDLSTVRGNGFGYQLEKIQRELPPPVFGG